MPWHYHRAKDRSDVFLDQFLDSHFGYGTLHGAGGAGHQNLRGNRFAKEGLSVFATVSR